MQKEKKDKKILTIKEVSEIIGVHQQTLRRWDEDGKLKAIRIGKMGHRKYRKSDVDKLLEIC